jgi:hypothetical protein
MRRLKRADKMALSGTTWHSWWGLSRPSVCSIKGFRQTGLATIATSWHRCFRLVGFRHSLCVCILHPYDPCVPRRRLRRRARASADGRAERVFKAAQYKAHPGSTHPFSTLLLSARQAGKLAYQVAFDSPASDVPGSFSATTIGEGLSIRGPFDERGHGRND